MSVFEEENDGLSTQEIESRVGGVVVDTFGGKVNLVNPDRVCFVYVFGEKGFFGVDVCGFDLSKRDYKVFSTPSAIRGTVGYCLFRIGGAKGMVVDPFCGSGTIAIEGALYFSGRSVQSFRAESFLYRKFFDGTFGELSEKKGEMFSFDSSFHCVNAAKKNAKIAAINKQIQFSRLDVEWLDTKFDRGAVEAIVTDVPRLSKHANVSDVKKVYNEFFYQAAFVLSKKGSVVVLTNKKDELVEAASGHGFVLSSSREIFSGKEKDLVLVFEKDINSSKAQKG